jgi:crotonobetainyl-CoA:carnitine CoA-transferase CaiB-like acyl-CoA transferase
MAESILNCAAEAIVTYTSEGVVIEREGNRCPEAAPQGLYRTRGPEQWLALSIANDSQWLALQSVLGHPAWAGAPKLNTHTGRRGHHDEIDAELRRWAIEQDLDTAVGQLIEKGVPAGALQDFRTSDQHPQFRALGHFEIVDHPVVGRHPVEGLPFSFSSVDRWIRSAAPTLGQHNREILTELLGLSDSEVDELQNEGLIGTRPRGA